MWRSCVVLRICFGVHRLWRITKYSEQVLSPLRSAEHSDAMLCAASRIRRHDTAAEGLGRFGTPPRRAAASGGSTGARARIRRPPSQPPGSRAKPARHAAAVYYVETRRWGCVVCGPAARRHLRSAAPRRRAERQGAETAFVEAGCCCVMQWGPPAPRLAPSTHCSGTMRRPGNAARRVAIASRSFRSESAPGMLNA